MQDSKALTDILVSSPIKNVLDSYLSISFSLSQLK